jgi:hypothetical protein
MTTDRGDNETSSGSLLHKRLHDPPAVAMGADVVLLRSGRGVVGAARLLTAHTEGSEPHSALGADGLRALDESSCPRHGGIEPRLDILFVNRTGLRES